MNIWFILLSRYKKGVNNIQPSKQAVNNGPQNGFISAPGNDHCDDAAQANAGPYIDGKYITVIIRPPETGYRKQDHN